jgi:hypothetical protein
LAGFILRNEPQLFISRLKEFLAMGKEALAAGWGQGGSNEAASSRSSEPDPARPQQLALPAAQHLANKVQSLVPRGLIFV